MSHGQGQLGAVGPSAGYGARSASRRGSRAIAAGKRVTLDNGDGLLGVIA
jgi:hypothetical protein